MSDEFERQLWEEYYGIKEVLQIKKVSDALRSLKPSLVLDAGCGEGWVSLAVQREGYKVIACDFSKSQLLKAKDLFFKKNKENIPLILSSLTHLPFKQGYYDSVICLDVIEHVPDMKLAIDECYRVLKRSGQLCISVPGPLHGIIYDKILLKLPFSKFMLKKLGRSSHGPGHFHVHRLSRNFSSILENSGFEVTKFYNLAFLGPYIATVKHLLKLFDVRFTWTIEAAIYADARRAYRIPLILGTKWMLICTRP